VTGPQIKAGQTEYTLAVRPAHGCIYLSFDGDLTAARARLEVRMESLLLSCTVGSRTGALL